MGRVDVQDGGRYCAPWPECHEFVQVQAQQCGRDSFPDLEVDPTMCYTALPLPWLDDVFLSAWLSAAFRSLSAAGGRRTC